MKTQNIILSLVIILVLFFSACREVTVTTKVNPDGTFTRIITVTGKDSSEVAKPDLPFPVDETWARLSSIDTIDSTIYIVTYTKTFRSNNDLNAEIKSDTSKYKNLEKEITVTKRFRFFFSYLNFKEVYKSANPFTKLDYHDYLTEEDIQWNSGLKIPVTAADSARQNEAEEKISTFFKKSFAAEIESVLIDGIKKLNNPLLKPEDVTMFHDSLVMDFDWNKLGGIEIIDGYRELSGNEAFSLLNDLKPPLFEDFQKKYESFLNTVLLDGYTEIVEMPGLITATNSAMLNGNQVRWEFQCGNVMVRDFEMSVESRVINYWAFVLAGVVMLALVVLLVVKAVRK
jgi:hypothetical protein